MGKSLLALLNQRPGKTLGAVIAPVLFVLLSIAAGHPASAFQPSDPGSCDRAAEKAAQLSGVPVSVLKAITRTETGRARNGQVQPWPWTVNMEGKGVWFASEKEAQTYVLRHYQRGARSFDVGCFQINYKWHGTAFSSIDEMFDPLANATYAAKFLNDLYLESGDWLEAAGAYHSRTPKYATRYQKRFKRILSRIEQNAAPLKAPPAPFQTRRAQARKPNRFPLLQQGNGAARLGSLVVLSDDPGSGGLFFQVASRGG